MNDTQAELLRLCPVEVAEYIDEIILPDYADGSRTASEITLGMQAEAEKRLKRRENWNAQSGKLK